MKRDTGEDPRKFLDFGYVPPQPTIPLTGDKRTQEQRDFLNALKSQRKADRAKERRAIKRRKNKRKANTGRGIANRLKP